MVGTFGNNTNAETRFAESNTQSQTGFEGRPVAVYSPDNKMVAVFYGGYGYGRMRMIEPTDATNTSSSSNAHNVGSVANFESSDHHARFLGACYDTSANKFIFAYSDNTDSYKAYIRTATVSGTNSSASISFGSKTTVETSNCKSLDLTYDSVNNRTYLVYSHGGSCKLRYVTLSGTNVSLGSATTVDDGTMGNSCQVVYSTTSNKVLVCWLRSSYNYIRAKAGTPGSSSISFGSAQNISRSSNHIGGEWDVIWHPDLNRFYTGYRNSSRYHEIREHEVDSSNVIDNGNDFEYSHITDSVAFCIPTRSLTLDKMLCSAGTQSDVHTVQYTWRLSDTISNLTGPNYFLGFPKQAYSNNATATIQTFGSVVEGFSGLDPGFPYYVQPDGTLGKTYTNQKWPLTGISGWDSANNEGYRNGWQPTIPGSGNNYSTLNDAPLAGTAVGTDKLLLQSSVQFGNPTSSWNHQNNHKHAP